jgi:NADH:ubiquinone oxidoreductase subunit 5 (subunit L)/multisubunit Na+/H+ antiporter MnhA subunit
LLFVPEPLGTRLCRLGERHADRSDRRIVRVALDCSGADGFRADAPSAEGRHGRLSLVAFHGLYEHTPALAICFLLTGLASVGFPGTFGCIGTELLVDGAVHTYPYIGVAVVVVAALNGIAVVQAYFRLFTGTRHTSFVPLGISGRERFAVLALAVLILLGGLFPQPWVASKTPCGRNYCRNAPCEDCNLIAEGYHVLNGCQFLPHW